MKIIILGAGRVGESVADSLVSERNDITVIDTDAERLRDLQARFDLRGVVGSGIEPAVLAEAGARDTDLLIACAAQDETNLVCCKMAQLLFNIPTRIARVRSLGFRVRYPAAGRRRFCGGPHHLPRGIAHALHRQAGGIPRGHAGARVRGRAGQPGVGACARRARPWWATRIAELRASAPDVAVRLVAIYRRFPDEPDRFVRLRGRHPHRAGRRGVRAGRAGAHCACAVGPAPPRCEQRAARAPHHDCRWRPRGPAPGAAAGPGRGALSPQDHRSQTRSAAWSWPRRCRLRCWCCRARPPTKTCSTTRAWRRWTCSWR